MLQSTLHDNLHCMLVTRLVSQCVMFSLKVAIAVLHEPHESRQNRDAKLVTRLTSHSEMCP